MYETGRLAEEVSWRKRSLELDPGRVGEMMALAITYLELGHDEGLAELRERMGDAGGQTFYAGFIDVISDLYAGNDAGAQEALQWLAPRLQGNPTFAVIAAQVFSVLGDYPAARAALLNAEPGLLDPASWPAFIEVYKNQACMAGWVLLRSGDEQSGLGLLTRSVEYLDGTLPQYIEDSYRYSSAPCHIALGSREPALAALEASFAHGRYGAWQLLRRWPLFEPLWGDPRFEAALQQAEQASARQREEVFRMEAAGTTRL
jgi:hypothetical protein